MITAFDQNWHTTRLPYSLALANTVNTGGSFSTSSGAVRNSKIWASAGFRGLGPVLTFPGAGMDGMGCGCGCNGKSAGMGQIFGSWDVSTWGFPEWALIGLGLYVAFSVLSTTKRSVAAVTGVVRKRRTRIRRRRQLKQELKEL